MMLAGNAPLRPRSHPAMNHLTEHNVLEMEVDTSCYTLEPQDLIAVIASDNSTLYNYMMISGKAETVDVPGSRSIEYMNKESRVRLSIHLPQPAISPLHFT